MDKFKLKKPADWAKLPCYQKLKYYGSKLTKDYAEYVDKISAKDIVIRDCPNVKVPQIVRILAGPDDITEQDLLSGHILKSAHGCKWNIVLNPTLKIDKIKQKLQQWNRLYSNTELQYTYLKPRFFIEEIIEDKYTGKSGNAMTFMIRCFHGKPYSVGVLDYSGITKCQNIYSKDFVLLEPAKFKFEKPSMWDEMMSSAAKLSEPFEFVRIDFYLTTNNEIYFSEYTFTPSNGRQVFSLGTEKKMGAQWV